MQLQTFIVFLLEYAVDLFAFLNNSKMKYSHLVLYFVYILVLSNVLCLVYLEESKEDYVAILNYPCSGLKVTRHNFYRTWDVPYLKLMNYNPDSE